MKTKPTIISSLLLWLLINAIFILKYVPRAGVSEWLMLGVWLLCSGLCLSIAIWFQRRIKDRNFLWPTAGLTLFMLAGIVAAILLVDPLSVRVDRWSATSYFIDALFRGEYPYGVHTHVSETHFPSPLPFWHYLNIPFRLMGDVGWQLVFFLLLTLASFRWFTGSWSKTFMFALVLALSPAYWWEVAVRSDGLNNMLLVFCFLLLMEKQKIDFGNRWWLLALLCGLIASTRLSALIPVAVYLFRPYVKAEWWKMVAFPLIVIAVVFLMFAPYIFWDTESWIFFSRNPFMSQTETGSIWVLVGFMLFGVAAAFAWRSFGQYMNLTGWFIFLFMGVSIIVAWRMACSDIAWRDCAACDISYLTLAMPFAAYGISELLKTDERVV